MIFNRRIPKIKPTEIIKKNFNNCNTLRTEIRWPGHFLFQGFHRNLVTWPFFCETLGLRRFFYKFYKNANHLQIFTEIIGQRQVYQISAKQPRGYWASNHWRCARRDVSTPSSHKATGRRTVCRTARHFGFRHVTWR